MPLACHGRERFSQFLPVRRTCAPLLVVLLVLAPLGASAPARAAKPKSAPQQKATGKKKSRPSALDATQLVAPPPAPSDPDAERIVRLQNALRDMLREGPMSGARVGVQVMRLQKAQLLFSYRAGQLFDPASNEKILTTATALARLGPEFRYRTVLFGSEPDEDGEIKGDIALRGSGDPSLTTQDLLDLAQAAVKRGVHHIAGGIVVDERAFDTHSGAPVDTNDTHDQLGYAPLTVNHNTFLVRVIPGHVGGKPEVTVEPPSDYLQIANSATTVAKGRSRLRVDTRSGGGGVTVVAVSGRVVEGSSGVVVRKRPLQPALFAGGTLGHMLRDLGVTIDKPAHVGNVSGKHMAELAVHESAPLALIIRRSNKDSNNFVAERVFQTTGVELYGAPATAAKGQRAITEYLAQVGLPSGSYHPTNGSGLAHTNRITPAALVQLLRTLYYDIRIAPDFLQSLAVAGVDGTIRRRFLGTDAVGLVRAKTGTLNGVSCLSGYVGQHDDVIVFSILTSGFRQRRINDVRRGQVNMVTAMLRFLKNSAQTPAQELIPQDMDVETMEESEGEVGEPSVLPSEDTPPPPPPPPTPRAVPQKP
jgi:D-alanyl-D-alanine carboxypeptidase/D-alanyl-D-alanine-endopeptidase (penicillin-binding protein 4)